MISVTIDQDKFTAAGLTFTHEDGAPVAYFTFTNPETGKPVAPVGVRIEGSSLSFFPDRSASQRTVLKMLGLL